MHVPVKAYRVLVSRKSAGKKYYNPESLEMKPRKLVTKQYNQLVLILGKLVQADVFGIDSNEKTGFAMLPTRTQVYREGNIWIAAK